MAANITSGNGQSYDPGDGIRIFQGMKPDVVMIQEFNYGDNSASAIRGFVDTAFGTSFSYYREGGAQIPNGVISRYPIIASGEWDDTAGDQPRLRLGAHRRPGPEGPLGGERAPAHLEQQRAQHRGHQPGQPIKANVPAGDYLAIGGDFNTDSRTEACLTTFAQVVTTARPVPGGPERQHQHQRQPRQAV